MNIISLFIVLLISMFSMNARCEVWHSSNKWNDEWEDKYQQWINFNLRKNIFTDSEGVLSGVATDCADALYDVRILFSYEHSLPFMINAPDVLKDKMKIFGSDTNMFDDVKEGRARVRAFLNYVNDEIGTENLPKDTFPVQIKRINSGIVYHVEWSLFGKINHHSYIVKGFNRNKELLYYASDAPKKVRELQIDTKYPRFSFESAPYGFRKWRWPEDLLLDEKQISPLKGYSPEEYQIAAKVGKRHILEEIRKILLN